MLQLAVTEIEIEQYKILVDLYKFYFDKLILVITSHFAISGAILSFYFANRSGLKGEPPWVTVIRMLSGTRATSPQVTPASAPQPAARVSELMHLALYLPLVMSYGLGVLLILSAVGLVKFHIAVSGYVEKVGAPRGPQVLILILSFALFGLIFVGQGVLIHRHLKRIDRETSEQKVDLLPAESSEDS